jgi:hypothetical protein
MLAIEHLSTMPELACVIVPTPCTDAQSVQPVLKKFSETKRNNFKFGTVSMNYECTDGFDGTISSTGVEACFDLNLVELLYK